MTDLSISIDGVDESKAMLEEAKPDGSATYRVKADTEYAVYVEYGTKHMSAQPYLRPAVNQTMRNAGSYAEDADDLDGFAKSLADAIAERAQDKAPVDTGRLRDSITVEELR